MGISNFRFISKKEEIISELITPIGLLDLMIQEYKAVYGDCRHDTYGNFIIEQLWRTLFDLDRERLVGSSKDFSKEVKMLLKNGETVSMTIDQIDDIVEDKIYKLHESIIKSASSFDGSFVLFQDD